MMEKELLNKKLIYTMKDNKEILLLFLSINHFLFHTIFIPSLPLLTPLSSMKV